MEKTVANQLPEVDSLPDGFVNSSTEPQAPTTPSSQKEKPLADYKDNFLEIDHLSESIRELGGTEIQSSENGAEKTQKLRTFPVPLSEKDTIAVLCEPVQLTYIDHFEQTERALITPNSAISVSKASLVVSGCNEGKEYAHGKHQSSKTLTGGVSDLHATHVTESSSSESIDKSRKQERSEVKRKTAKRTFKSEKEFLEFTLKYQQVISERDAAIAVRDKLESLCRELQRQNKMLMDECKEASTEGRNLRLDLSAKFQDAIKDVNIKLEEQKDEYLSQLKENEMLRTKLKQFADQCALCEQQYAQKLKQKTLELQIADLKIKQHEEKLAQEQYQIKLYAEQVSQLLATEKSLRLQLTADGEKFQQFQDALLKSNEVFETFKEETEKMAKAKKELKKENLFLRSKCDRSDITLIELVEECELMKKQLERTKNQKEKLESLCRSLQAERRQQLVRSNSSETVHNSSETVPI